MNEEHHPYDNRTFSSGADSDTEKELLGAKDTGDYIDQQNGTFTGKPGLASGVRKLGGEVVIYPDNLPAPTYRCMWEGQVTSYHVEIWADPAALQPSLIRIDGVIVLQSVNFPVTVADPIQVASTDNAEGGEITLACKAWIPLVLNVKDMVDSLISDPTKYFSAFTTAPYEVNLAQNLDTATYVEHVILGGGGGLPVGNYQYRLRLTTRAGDRTNLSVPTPMIPVVENMSSASAQYPYSKTYSRQSSPNFNTRYGIKIRFRVTNFFGFDFVEVVRVAWNQGAGIGFNPTPVVVARIDVTPNQVSVQEFIDPGDQNIDPPISISDAELNQQTVYIKGAKAPRYFDRRLMLGNLQLESRVPDLQFTQIAGSEINPAIENLGKAGFGDPWNFVYRRHYTHGERYGFAINGFDGVFGQFYAQKIPNATDYQIPNRRDVVSATTALYSYGGTVKAATVNGTVDQTHEVFDHYDAIAKNDKCSFKNIYRREDVGVFGYKTKVKINENCDEDGGAIENHGAQIDYFTLIPPYVDARVFPYYKPYYPISGNDQNVSGHNYIVNVEVSKSNHLIGSNNADYTPPGFGLNYYSQGLLLGGVTNIPDSMKGFSVVRTDAAGRILAQGLGFYFLEPAEFNLISNSKLCTKSTRKMWLFCPDIQDGIVSSDVVNDIIASPLDYQVQLVSPLGFFSEMYNFEKNNIDPDRDRLVDMISYVRMLRDVTGGSINPLEDANMGINGGDGNRYVAYGKWRNINQQPALYPANGNGNRVINIVSVERIIEGRGSYLVLEVDTDIYGRTNVGGVTDREFEDDGMKDWTEPVYMVNIIRSGANAKDADVTDYMSCHFQKIESVIGRGNGLADQTYPLVDERWEDCIPALDAAWPTATTDRYLYIRRTTGVVERWINITFKTPAQRITIINDIVNNGNYLGSTGVYTHTNVNNRFFTIVFDQPGFYPAQDDLILVRYDDTAPIRFWGGDATIGEAVFAPIDRQADAYDNAAATQFAIGLGFPYRTFKMNPRHYVIARTTGLNRIQDEPWAKLGYIRQMCAMFTVESRAALPYSFCQNYPNESFPQIHYVMRPNRWDPSKSASEQNIYPQYETDYGADEITQWKWGGFRFLQNINPEHTNLPQKRYFSSPQFGFQEQLDQPYMVAYSPPRVSSVQNAPGVRTFPGSNVFVIDDKTGEIKMLWSAPSDKGDNAYAFTERGTDLLLTNKQILSDMNGNELAYVVNDAFIKGEYWLSRSIGMSDEFWRSAAEFELPIVSDSSMTQQRIYALCFANKESVFMFYNNEHFDIGRARYYNKISERISQVAPGYTTAMIGVVETDRQEYWLSIFNRNREANDVRTFMFSLPRKRWIGYNQYRFDKLAMRDKQMLATRESQTFVLDSGFIMNGQPVEWWLEYPTSPEPALEKEFIRIFVNSLRSQKPTSIEYYDKQGNLLGTTSNATGPLYLKWYGRWEQFIPRQAAGARLRMQNRLLIVRIIFNLQSDFEMVMSGVQAKLIK